MRFGKFQWSSFDWGVYEVNAIPEVQVTNTRMDQWGFQGIIIVENIGNAIFKGALARFGQISMEFLCIQGHCIL